MAGYSKTPLAKKLGIKEGFMIKIVNEPAHYLSLFSDFPIEVTYARKKKEDSIDFIHLFCKTHADLEMHGSTLMKQLKKDGLMWVSWPKQSSNIDTELTREIIRDFVLGIGLVDVKVCAVDDDWSGLKFVYRLKDRT